MCSNIPTSHRHNEKRTLHQIRPRPSSSCSAHSLNSMWASPTSHLANSNPVHLYRPDHSGVLASHELPASLRQLLSPSDDQQSVMVGLPDFPHLEGLSPPSVSALSCTTPPFLFGAEFLVCVANIIHILVAQHTCHCSADLLACLFFSFQIGIPLPSSFTNNNLPHLLLGW